MAILFVTDIDGTLQGYEPSAVRAAWGPFDRLEVQLPTRGGRKPWGMHVAPGLIDGIEKLRAEYAIDLCWVTTWLEGNRVPLFVEALGGRLDGGRMAAIPPRLADGITLPPRWRIEAVVAEVRRARPDALVWCDDMAPFDRERLLDPLGIPYLAIAPNEFSGLTPSELARIREFIEAHGVRR